MSNQQSGSGAFFPASKVAEAAQRALAYCTEKRRERDTKEIVTAFHRYLGATLWERITGRSNAMKTCYRTRSHEQTDKVAARQWFEDYVKPGNLHHVWDGPYWELGWLEFKTDQMKRLGVLIVTAQVADKNGSPIFLSVEDIDLFPNGI